MTKSVFQTVTLDDYKRALQECQIVEKWHRALLNWKQEPGPRLYWLTPKAKGREELNTAWVRKLRAEVAGLSVKRCIAERSEVMSGGVEGNERAQIHIRLIWSCRKQITIKSIFDESSSASDKICIASEGRCTYLPLSLFLLKDKKKRLKNNIKFWILKRMHKQTSWGGSPVQSLQTKTAARLQALTAIPCKTDFWQLF